MKKFFVLLMAIAMVFTSMIVVNAEGSAALSFESVVDAEKGSEVDIPVLLKNNPGLAYLKIEVKLEEGLELKEITRNNDGFALTPNLEKGVFTMDNTDNVTGEALVTLTIAVAEDAKGELNIALKVVEAYDQSTDDVAVADCSGTITVAGAEEEPEEPVEPEEPTLDSIKVSGAKTNFHVGDTFVTGADFVVIAVYSDKTEKDVTDEAKVTAPSLDTAGKADVVVVYEDKVTEYSIDIAGHTYEWVKDADGHYKACECGSATVKEAHTADAVKCTEDQICKVCGYVMAVAGDHTYGSAVTKFDDEGHWTEQSCTECGDVKVSVKSAHEDDENCSCGFTAHKHVIINNGKNYDDESHWNICCQCDEIFDKEPHNLVTVIEETDIYNPTTEIVCTYCVECLYRVVYERHVCKFEQQYDDLYHWDECIDEECGKIINHEKHDYTGWYEVEGADQERRDCKVCDYYQVQDIVEDDGYDKYDAFAQAMLYYRNRSLEIFASANEGGTITPDGVTKVKPAETVKYFIEAADGYAIKAVLVDDKDVGAVTEYTFKNVQKDHTIEVVFEKTVWANPFADVASDAAYIDAVEFVYENGLFEGVSATEFAPDVTMTRAMFVTVLGRLNGVNAADFAGVSFDDVVAGEWYAPYVEWAAKNGIIVGYGDGKFGVNDEITVEQAAVIMARYAAFVGQDISAAADLGAYADAGEVADWALSQMKWAVAEGIYAGANGMLSPKAPASRALVAEILYAFAK